MKSHDQVSSASPSLSHVASLVGEKVSESGQEKQSTVNPFSVLQRQGLAKSAAENIASGQWYWDRDVQFLLKNQLKDGNDAHIMAAVSSQKELQQRIEQAFSNNVSTTLDNATEFQKVPIIIPLFINYTTKELSNQGNHWVALLLKPTVDNRYIAIYNDPAGQEISTATKQLLRPYSSALYDLQLKQQNNSDDCGAYIIEDLICLARLNTVTTVQEVREKVSAFIGNRTSQHIRNLHASLLSTQSSEINHSIDSTFIPISVSDTKSIKNLTEFLAQGDAYLEENLLEQAEYAYANALKIADKESDFSRQVMIMQKMGDVYLEYGKKKGIGEDFTKAVALYNAAIVRCKDEEKKRELITRCKQAERTFLEKILNKSVDEPLISSPEEDEKNRNFLLTLRKNVETKLKDLDTICNPILQKDENVQREQDLDRAEKIRALQHELTEAIKLFFRNIVLDCSKTLNLPFTDAVAVALGSIARDEASTHSDFEWAILLKDYPQSTAKDAQEQEKDYKEIKQQYRYLTYLTHIRVLNLRETILPSMAIRSLNDFYTKDISKNWFYDAISPRGFSFDGLMPGACKLPTGEKDEHGNIVFELIHTPEQMAKYQYDSANTQNHLASILSNVVEVVGDKEIVEDYVKRVEQILSEVPKEIGENKINLHSRAQSLALTLIRKDRITYDPSRINLAEENGKLYSVKKELFRFISTTVEALFLYCFYKDQQSIPTAKTTWDRIEALARYRYINEEAAANLKIAASIGAELRLRAYLAKGRQDETMAIASALMAEKNKEGLTEKSLKEIFHLQNLSFIFRFYYTALPLQSMLKKFCLSDILPEARIKLLQTNNFFDNDSLNKGKIHERVLQYEEAKKCFKKDIKEAPSIATYHALGLTYNRLGKYEKAIQYAEKAFRLHTSLYPDNTHVTEARIKEISDIITLLGCLSIELTEYDKAIEYFLLIINIIDRYQVNNAASLKAGIWVNLGMTYFHMEKYQDADRFYQKAFSFYNTLPAIKETAEIYAVASLLDNFGILLRAQGKYQEALQKHQEALVYYEKLYGHLPNLEVARCKALIGTGTLYLGKHEQALTSTQEAFSMFQRLFPEQIPIEGVMLLDNLGIILFNQKQYDEAIFYHLRALELFKRYSTKLLPLSALAVTYFNLGNAYLEKGQCEEARKWYLTCAAHYNYPNAHQPNTKLAAALMGMGRTYYREDNFEQAKTYYEEALKIKRSIYKNMPHPEIAISIYNLSGIYWSTNNKEKALDYMIEAYQILLNTIGYLHPQTQLVYKTLCNSYIKWGSALLNNNRIQEALAPKFQITQINLCDPALHEQFWVNYYNANQLEEAVKHLEILQKLTPDIQKNIHNLGCLYHIQAQLAKQSGRDAEEKEKIKQAEHYLSKALAPQSDIQTEFANFLIRTNRPSRAIPYLERAIASKAHKGTLSYSIIEKPTLDLNLQQEIEFQGKVTLDGYIFAYYLLAQTHQALGQQEKALEALSHLTENIFELEQPNALYYSLLGHAYKELGEYKEAITYFDNAFLLYSPTSKHATYTLAEENKRQCKIALSHEPLSPLEKSFLEQLNPEKGNQAAKKIQHSWQRYIKKPTASMIEKQL